MLGLARNGHRDYRAGTAIEEIIAENQDRAVPRLLVAANRIQIRPVDLSPPTCWARFISQSFFGKTAFFEAIKLSEPTCQASTFLTFSKQVYGGLERPAAIRVATFAYPSVEIGNSSWIQRDCNLLYHST